jgi:hypothetical protein
VRFAHNVSSISAEAFGFQSDDVGDATTRISPKRQSIVTGPSRSSMRRRVRTMAKPVPQSLIDQFQVLEFNVVKPEQEGGHLPIIVTCCPPMLDGKNSKGLAKVSLQCHPVQR